MSPAPSSHRSQINSRKEKRMRKVDTFAPHNDGHLWRKYGEKKINNTNFPRYYYRCTYKDDMNCPATKQVQQKDHSDPPLYAVTYYNEHSCDSAFLPLSPPSSSCRRRPGRPSPSALTPRPARRRRKNRRPRRPPMPAAARPLPAPRRRRGEARRRRSVTRPCCGGPRRTRGAPAPAPWSRSWRPAAPSATTPSRVPPAPCWKRW